LRFEAAYMSTLTTKKYTDTALWLYPNRRLGQRGRNVPDIVFEVDTKPCTPGLDFERLKGGSDREITNWMGRVMISDTNNELILAARLLLATLFLIFGWRKLRDYTGTVRQIVQLRAPVPVVAAALAIFMELPVAFAVAVGAFARASTLLLFLYTLGTALIGHRYWTLTGAERVDGMDGFYKNLSIMGGLLLLYVTGAGKYSIDALCNIATP
jgi:putative oxidoreductase